MQSRFLNYRCPLRDGYKWLEEPTFLCKNGLLAGSVHVRATAMYFVDSRLENLWSKCSGKNLENSRSGRGNEVLSWSLKYVWQICFSAPFRFKINLIVVFFFFFPSVCAQQVSATCIALYLMYPYSACRVVRVFSVNKAIATATFLMFCFSWVTG